LRLPFSDIINLPEAIFDLNYLRPLQLDEGYSVTQFLRTSQEEIRKKRIIELFDQLKNHKLIDTQFRIVQKNGLSTTVKQLTPLLLTKSKNIFFYEIIHSNIYNIYKV